VQNTAASRDVGAATGAVTLSRMGGASIAISIYGAIIAARLSHVGVSIAGVTNIEELTPKMMATLPPEARSALLENAPEWRALTMSKDAFPALPLSTIKRIKAPTLLLSGQRSLGLANLIDRRLEVLLSHARRMILANATHEMWNEYPEECRNAAIEFFAIH